MCADEGHYDNKGAYLPKEKRVGVMCADEGHYDSVSRIRAES